MLYSRPRSDKLQRSRMIQVYTDGRMFEIRHSQGISIFKLFINSFPRALNITLQILLRNLAFHFPLVLLRFLVEFLLLLLARFPLPSRLFNFTIFFLGNYFRVAVCLSASKRSLSTCFEREVQGTRKWPNSIVFSYLSALNSR